MFQSEDYMLHATCAEELVLISFSICNSPLQLLRFQKSRDDCQTVGLSLQLIMSHHASCGDLLRRPTCLSPSPSHSFTSLLLSRRTFPLFSSNTPSVSPPLSKEGEIEKGGLLYQYSPSAKKLRLNV